jgi:Transposase
MTDERRWYVGVDWASENHHVFLTDGVGSKIGEKIFKHSGEGLADMAAWLMTASGAVEPRQVYIAIEVPHGPVVETLIERAFNVYAINPKQMDRFRDRFTLAGAKDDSRDAETMASALRTDVRCFRLLAAADPIVVELREWSRISEDLGTERIRLTNRMRQQLWRYFPAMLELETDLSAEWLLELWQTVPTPEKAVRVRETTIAKLLKRNRIRRFDASAVIATLRKQPVTVADGTTVAATAHIDTLIARIRLLNQQIGDAHRQLDKLVTKLSGSGNAEETAGAAEAA